MATRSISQLDTQPTANETDLFEVAAVDSNSASGYKSGKMSAEVMAEGMLNTYTYPTAMPNMQNKTITGAINTLLGNFAPTYDSEATYAEGDVVTYNGQLYKANVDIEEAEAFDSEKWDAGTAADFFEGGGETPIAYWDFTDSLVDKVNGLTASLNGSPTQDEDGIKITSATQYISFPYYLFMNARKYEIEFGDCVIPNRDAWAKLFSIENTSISSYVIGFQRNKSSSTNNPNGWGVYRDVFKASGFNNGDLLDNKKLIIEIDIRGHWTVYVGDTLIFDRDDVVMPSSSTILYIGSTDSSPYPMTVKSLKVY